MRRCMHTCLTNGLGISLSMSCSDGNDSELDTGSHSDKSFALMLRLFHRSYRVHTQ